MALKALLCPLHHHSRKATSAKLPMDICRARPGRAVRPRSELCKSPVLQYLPAKSSLPSSGWVQG